MATKHHLNNPLYLQYAAWLKGAAIEIARDRGYASRASQALGVPRQTMSRWLAGRTPMPAWAAIALRQWMRKEPPGVVRLG